jgi:hypothetical protein
MGRSRASQWRFMRGFGPFGPQAVFRFRLSIQRRGTRHLQQRGTPTPDTDALQASQFSVGSREARAVNFF